MVRGYTIEEIAGAVGGELRTEGRCPPVRNLCIDSRRLGEVEGTLFIALKGPRHDGHAHLGELVARGVRYAIVQRGHPDIPASITTIAVEDTLSALQRLAAWHRARFTYPVIGITGSNGKTVVKEWLFQLLRHEERIVRSPGSWNSQVGVPLSVWEMGPEHTLGIFEAGISQGGEMERLAPIIRPTIGVLTNIGPAHSGGFTDDAEKCREKCTLFRDAGVVIGGADNPVVRSGLAAAIAPEKLRQWSREHPAFVRVKEERIAGEATEFLLEHAGAEHWYRLPFTDAASAENALTCITVLLHLGRSPELINAGLARLSPVDMRMRTTQGVHGSTLIDDSYSNDLASLRIALDQQSRLAHGRRRIVVLSDPRDSATPERELHTEVARMLAGSGVHEVIGVGPAISRDRDLFPAGSCFFADAEAVMHAVDARDLEGAVVLVKGAREFRLERLVERWQYKVHGTELEVDLGAVRHNLNHYRAIVGPEVRIMCMVKAFGYGTGALELARLFAHERVAYLGVAYADEGIELRQQGITTPVLVMNPEPVPMGTLHRFGLEGEVYDARSLGDAIRYARSAPDAPPVHIKLDTGMHRLGFTEQEIPGLLSALSDRGPLRIASILSHLAASEDQEQDDFTRAQIALFSTMADRIDAALGHRPIRHLANSGAITRFPEARFDMVRLGIGLHGVGVSPQETAELMPTVTLRTVIAQVKHVPAGDSVGYGRRFVAAGDTRIAILPIGYADGLSRRLGNGVGKAWIHSRQAPFVGNVCMDMCMVDVSGIDCAPGDEAVIFGPGYPLQRYAADLGTIPYEALTSISQRVRRVYLHE